MNCAQCPECHLTDWRKRNHPVIHFQQQTRILLKIINTFLEHKKQKALDCISNINVSLPISALMVELDDK